MIGVTGGSSSGKTSTCYIIQKQLYSHVTILSMDSFYLGVSDVVHGDDTDMDVNDINFDHPSSFDWDLMFQVLLDLKDGKPTEVPIYNFETHSRDGFTLIKPEKCIILEGILALYDPRVRDLFDMKIFVDTPSDIRLIRRIRRDIAERGRTLESVLDQNEKTVIMAFDQFIEPTKKYADLIVPRGKTNLTAISVMVNQIKESIK